MCAFPIIGILTTLAALFAYVDHRVLPWGGIRGAIPFALALSLPFVPERDTLILATYAVAVFSILAQGTTIRAAEKR